MKLSTKLITAAVAMALLAVGVIGIGSQGTATASHEDDGIFVTNNWSNRTTDPGEPGTREFVGSGGTLWTTFVEQDGDGNVEGNVMTGADMLTVRVEDQDLIDSRVVTQTFTWTGSGSINDVEIGPPDSPLTDDTGLEDASVTDVEVVSGDVFVSNILDVGSFNDPSDPAVIRVQEDGISEDESYTLRWFTVDADMPDVEVMTDDIDDVDVLDIPASEFELVDLSQAAFEATIQLVDFEELAGSNPAASPPQIGIRDGSRVEFTYESDHSGATRDLIATATAETGAPQVSITSPEDGVSTQDDDIDFVGSVSESQSGLATDEIQALIDEGGSEPDIDYDDPDSVNDLTGGRLPIDPTATGALADLPTGVVDGAANTTFEFPNSNLADGYTVWQVRAADLAGNIGFSDADEDPANNFQNRGQAHVLQIDTDFPDLEAAFTGVTVGQDDDGDPVLELNNRMAVAVQFDESIDQDSVSAADFEVEADVDGSSQDETPASATVGTDDFSNFVFLMLDVEQDPDSESRVRLVGSVTDIAGNSLTGGSVLASDAIAPELNVVLSGGSSESDPSGLTNDEMTITIESDEALSSRPSVSIFSEASTSTAETTLSVSSSGSLSWTATYSGAGHAGGDEDNPGGINKSVFVEANDSAGNVPELAPFLESGTVVGQATEGVKDADSDDEDAHIFTLDTFIADELNMTAPGEETADSNPIVRLEFGEEVMGTSAWFGPTEGDLADVTEALVHRGERVLYPASAPDQGEYEFQIVVVDDAGNESEELSATFERVARDPFAMELLPGSNFVSFPRPLVDGEINNVFGDEAITSVTTFDPDNGASPLVSQRDEGELVGDVDDIEMGRGYIVVANAVVSLEVDMVDVDPGSGPPTANLSEGWSLTGIIDLAGDPATGLVTEFGNTVSSRADYYPDEVSQVYTWDVVTKRWMEINPADPVNSGGAYWTYATEPTVIVP